jgi:type I restriction enzyme M protein
MLDTETKRRIDTARDILVGKVPDPKSQVEQITIAMIYKFMDDMDAEAEELGGKRQFFSGEFEKFGWAKLMSPAMGGHEVLNLYAEAITRMTENEGIPPLFRDIFKNVYLPYRDPETLKSFLKIIDDFEYDHSERLGDAFEYLLSVLGAQGDAGQFRTPRHIIDFMVQVMDPKKEDSILDPACGTAGFLISSYKHILKANSKDGRNGAALTPDERKTLTRNIKGYDISPDMVRLSLVNLYLHGFTDPHIFEYDTLTSEDNWNEYADMILANPPFMSPKGGIKPHKRFSFQAKRSEVLFVDYIAEHLTPSGRAAIIVPEGIIFQSQNAYKQLREMLVKNYLYAVVSLPAGVFNPYSGVKTSILLMDKTKAKQNDSILFVKVDNDGFGLGAQRRPIDKNDLPSALEALQSGVMGCSDIDAHWVEKTKIEESGDWNLSGERYKESLIENTDYEMVVLGKVLKTTSGGTPLKSKIEYYNNGTIPWLRSGEVSQGLIYHSELFITEKGLKESSAKLFPVDTVLVAMYGATAGQVGLLKFKASTNQAICGILPDENFNPYYLYLILKSMKDEMIRLSGGGAQPNISQTIIKKFKIPLPPLSVQEEIVAEIDGYQKIIDGARQVVDNYKPTIKIDPDWKMVEVDELCNLVRGSSPRPKSDKRFYGGNVPRLMVSDVTRDRMYTTPLTDFLTEEGAKHSRLMKKNEVVMAVSGNPGLPTILAIDAYIHDGFVGYRELSKNLIPEYFYFVLLWMKEASNRQSIGAVFKNLSTTQIKHFKIPVPPLSIQQEIVTQIASEQEMVNANKKLIEIYEQKIKDKIGEVCGE